jgi:hypothetical protein
MKLSWRNFVHEVTHARSSCSDHLGECLLTDLRDDRSRPTFLHGFLPLLGDDGRLDVATLNIESGVRRIALRVHNLILPITENGSPSVYFRQKHPGSNGSFPL